MTSGLLVNQLQTPQQRSSFGSIFRSLFKLAQSLHVSRPPTVTSLGLFLPRLLIYTFIKKVPYSIHILSTTQYAVNKIKTLKCHYYSHPPPRSCFCCHLVSVITTHDPPTRRLQDDLFLLSAATTLVTHNHYDLSGERCCTPPLRLAAPPPSSIQHSFSCTQSHGGWSLSNLLLGERRGINLDKPPSLSQR